MEQILEVVSESLIRRQASAESLRRGQGYYRRGAVISLSCRGDVLQAEVEGSQYEPYRVRVAFDQGGITSAVCSCPYDWGGWCKHIVAALLACLHEPEEIEERPSLDELLANLDGEQLRGLLLDLAAQDASLVDVIESRVTMLRSIPVAARAVQEATPPPRHTAIDPGPARRQVRAILHSLDRMRRSEAYWHVGDVVDQVRQVVCQADDFIEAGDGRNAFLLLEAVTEAYVEDWTCLDDSDGFVGGFFGELGETWAEAALVADLSPAERQAWADRLTEWQREIGDYGVDDTFDVAQAAILQGWDYPPLQRVLQGEITRQGAWEKEAPWYADDLALLRLKTLERQGRFQEYLYLAEAEGQVEPYATMLARVGRVQEAVDAGLQHFYEPGQVLALAQALRERGELEAAMRVAEHGLTLEGAKGPLAAWLSDLAAAMGEPELALEAATVAFRASPGMEAYLRVRELSGPRWTELQLDLLAYLRRGSSVQTQAQVDIFVYEGLLDDAIAAVEKGGGYALIEQVMDAVVEQRPEWVIRAARKQAERIIGAGQAKYYHHAVDWLERARAAYQAAGREAEWKAYLRDLRERHGRKYKLMGMLKGFDM